MELLIGASSSKPIKYEIEASVRTMGEMGVHTIVSYNGQKEKVRNILVCCK